LAVPGGKEQRERADAVEIAVVAFVAEPVEEGRASPCAAQAQSFSSQPAVALSRAGVTRKGC
jgi:hypothetical protein